MGSVIGRAMKKSKTVLGYKKRLSEMGLSGKLIGTMVVLTLIVAIAQPAMGYESWRGATSNAISGAWNGGSAGMQWGAAAGSAVAARTGNPGFVMQMGYYAGRLGAAIGALGGSLWWPSPVY